MTKLCSVCKLSKPINEFNKSYSHCISCQSIKFKTWYSKNKKKVRKNNKKWLDNNPNFMTSYTKQWLKNNPDKVKKNKRNQTLRKYNLTEEEFSKKVIEQNNRCSICNSSFSTTPHIDHDHATGKVRGLLCKNCNLTLGFVNDNVQILSNMIEYLKRV